MDIVDALEKTDKVIGTINQAISNNFLTISLCAMGVGAVAGIVEVAVKAMRGELVKYKPYPKYLRRMAVVSDSNHPLYNKEVRVDGEERCRQPKFYFVRHGIDSGHIPRESITMINKDPDRYSPLLVSAKGVFDLFEGTIVEILVGKRR